MSVLQNLSLDNNIIAREDAKVKWTEKKQKNLTIATKFLRLSQLIEDGAERYLTKGEDGKAYLERVRAEEYKKRGYRMKNCSRFITVSVCPDCHRSVASSATLCRDRVCPACAWRLSAQQSAEMLQTLSYISDIEDYTAVFLTLTVQNCACDQLAPTLEMMSSAWNRLLSRKKNRELIKGTARSVEISYNKTTHTFHPHYHIIMLLEPDNRTIGELNAYFNKEWQTATRVLYQPITDLRKIENRDILEYDKPTAERYKKAILETFKYTIKDDDLAEMPLGNFRFYVDGVQGKRLTAYTGIFKEARAQLDFSEELDDESATRKCPDCNEQMLQAVYQWSFSKNTYQRFIESVTKS
jgi:plasmid rolling circle replication initiator protein Rep